MLDDAAPPRVILSKAKDLFSDSGSMTTDSYVYHARATDGAGL